MENSNNDEKDTLKRHPPYARVLRIFCLSVSVFSFSSAIVMRYCEGRANTTWMVPPLFPALIVPDFLLFLSTAVLFFCMFGSFRARRNVKAVSLTFSVSFVLFVVYFGVNWPRLYLHGFKNYAKTVLTADKWRTISRAAHAHITAGDSLRKPEEIDDDASLLARWAVFTNGTQIQKLGQDDTIYVYVPDSQTTEVEIGGSFVGVRRGVVIYSNTNNISPPEDSVNGPPLFFAHDIASFLVTP